MEIAYKNDDFRFLAQNAILLFERMECKHKSIYLQIIKERVQSPSCDTLFLKSINLETTLQSTLSGYFGMLFDEKKRQNLQKTKELFEKSLQDGAYFVALFIFLCGEFFVMEYYDEPEKSSFSLQNIQVYQMH